LDRADIRHIVDLQLIQLDSQLSPQGYSLEVTDTARELLVAEGYDPRFGARPLKRVIQQRLQNGLSNRILAGEFPEGARLVVDGQADGFAFTANPPAGTPTPLPSSD
ncbi:MAG: hypothetical protein VB859_15535, partial [Planctomycetaceae bacterium]